MIFKNAIIYDDNFKFRKGYFIVRNGVFTEIIYGKEKEISETDEKVIDLNGKYVIPGLIDIHFHGNSGVDFSEGDYEGLKRIAYYLARNGITSFAPASMTLPENVLQKAYKAAVRLRDEKPNSAARIRGLYMEGPFFSHEKKGAQAEEHLVLPDIQMFRRLQDSADGMIKIACVAPELPGAFEFIEKTSQDCRISIAHTTASYDETKQAINAGARHITHLFNAMPPFLHRSPGVIGAAFEDDRVTVELISDGIHIHESVIRATFALFSADRVVLISDSLSACGAPEGNYRSGGIDIIMKGEAAYLTDGKTLAGSTTNLFECMKKAISFGVKKEDAIRAATINPAKVINANNITGSISPGKSADFVICDSDFNIDITYIQGIKVED